MHDDNENRAGIISGSLVVIMKYARERILDNV